MASQTAQPDFFTPPAGRDVVDNVFEDGVRICAGTDIQGFCAVGRRTKINGATVYQNTTIGRYCSIARGAAVGAPDHPMTGLTTSLHFPAITRSRTPQETRIGHDVWIGANATVLADTSIGHGAVIAAGAVVTRDVRPYAIVVGIPAREVRRRFSDEVCARLLGSRWWDLPDEELHGLPMADVDAALEWLEAHRPDVGRGGDR